MIKSNFNSNGGSASGSNYSHQNQIHSHSHSHNHNFHNHIISMSDHQSIPLKSIGNGSCDGSVNNGGCDGDSIVNGGSGNNGNGNGSTRSTSRFRFLSWTEDTCSIREFVKTVTLPRVVRVTNCEEASLVKSLYLPNDVDITQPLLLFKKYRPVKVQAKCLKLQKNGKWKEVGPSIVIPDSFPGWFSMLTPDGKECAMMLTSMGQVAAVRVPAFLTKFDVPVYKLTDSNEPGSKSVYLKSTARAGSILRLLGVWADMSNKGYSQTYSKASNFIGGSLGGFGGRIVARSLSHGGPQPAQFQYIQCLSLENEVLFIPFSATGVFYPIAPRGGRNSQHIYPLGAIARSQRLPIRVKMIYGGMPTNVPDFTGTLEIEAVDTEDVVLACTLLKEKPTLFELDIDCDLHLSQMTSEDLFIKSTSYQSALTFCQIEGDLWKRQIKPFIGRRGTFSALSLENRKKSLRVRQPSSPPPPSKLSLLFRPSGSSSFGLTKDPLRRSKSFNVEIQSVSLSVTQDEEDINGTAYNHPQGGEDSSKKLSTLFNFMAGKSKSGKSKEKSAPSTVVARQSQYNIRPPVPDVLSRVPSKSNNYNNPNGNGSSNEIPYGRVRDEVIEEENIYAEIGDVFALKLNINPIHQGMLNFRLPHHVHNQGGSNMSSLLKGGGGSDGAFSGTLSGTFSSSNPSNREEDIYDNVF